MSTEEPPTMHIDPSRAKHLTANLTTVLQRVHKVTTTHKVRIIAVSKLKPANDILALHTDPSLSHLDFGENYAQELTEKAKILPKSIRWHMIGALQTNKCKPLAEQVDNLWCVSSVDTSKKADALNKGREGKEGERLRVLVQVNTSGEESKSGVEPGREVVELCRYVREECRNLRLGGLMTIGAIARSQEKGGAEDVNEDFVRLREVRAEVCRELGVEEGELELSMGMSSDFEAAIAQGSDEVRIGTTIFGDRPAKKDAKILD